MKRTQIAQGLNALILMGEAVATYISFNNVGWSFLQYYTVLSNLRLAASAFIFIVHPTSALTAKLRFTATACISLTFLVTAALLAPTSGPDGFHHLLLSGDGLYYHFLCPILSILSFILLENGRPLKRKDILLPMALTLLYAIATTILNIARLLYGPYFFLHVYEQSVWMSIFWFIVIVGMVGLLAWLLFVLRRRK